MLAGLIIATHDTADRAGTLTATLPFGGVTLIEYQARLLIGVDVSQIIVMVATPTPELVGAINRIARRGIAVDTVRSAAEAAEKLHPLSRVLMLADGLTTTPPVIATMAREGGDALLVVEEDVGEGAFERVGGGMAWAGIARLDPRRIAELAALPRDYDMEATLVRLAAQSHATHVRLSADALVQGHGIDHRGIVLVERGRSVLRAAVSTGTTWFDRAIVAPLARLLVPLAVPRAIPAMAIGVGGAALAMCGLALLWFGHSAIGTTLALLATLVCALGAKLAALRDESGQQRWLEWAVLGLPAVAILFDGRAVAVTHADGVPQVVAVAAVIAAALAERAATVERPVWAGTPPAYLAVATVGAVVGAPTAGLALAALLATVTLTDQIEQLRRHA